jgi:lipopolysaccharide transport system ATP-binding protein
MSDSAIKVEGLSKQYHIGSQQKSYDRIGAQLVDMVKMPLRRASRILRGQATGAADLTETIWALTDISLEIKHGEVVGIIGRNGAGKTTFLKILSRITEPTEGYADVYGRVGSLLEVGTGFHPDLTGRENIYLNGAILGMKKKEIDHRFDEIVAFSEIERFIDTPVKHYSSGMYVRLAFAVAAHLDPEILLVDEVLAVGDASFQKKCLGKMRNVTSKGRTVLFVSHNMVAVQSLCDRAIWLDEGRIVQDGLAGDVVSNYSSSYYSDLTEQVWEEAASAPGNDKIRMRRVCVRPENGAPSTPIDMDMPLVIEVEFWNLEPDVLLYINLYLINDRQVVVFTTSSTETDTFWQNRPLPKGLFRSICRIPGSFLNSGLHYVSLRFFKNLDNRATYRHDEILSFNVLDLSQRQGSWFGKEPGAVRPKLEWQTELISGGDVNR